MKPADNVRKIREERLISKMEWARLAGISAATIDRIERSEICRMETKRKIIFALGFTLSEKNMVFPNSLMAPIHDRIPVVLHLTEDVAKEPEIQQKGDQAGFDNRGRIAVNR
jgi:predicted transcriptional regulator